MTRNLVALLTTAIIMFGPPVLAAETAAPEDVVMSTNDFTVTIRDFDLSLEVQGLTGERKERALGRNGAVAQVFENFYLIRSLAADAEHNEAIDMDRIDWEVRNHRERLLMERQLNFEVEKILKDVDLDALAEAEYKASREKYMRPEQVSAAHILISVEERSPEEAKAIAESVLAKLEAGENFEDLVAEYSDDPGSKSVGGELGFFGRARMVKPFEDAAFALTEPGEIAPLTESRFGFHIIRLTERQEARQLSFEEVKPRILKQVEQQARIDAQKTVMTRVREEAPARGLHVNVELLDELKAQYFTEEAQPAPEDIAP